MLGALRELIRPERAAGEADQSEGTPAIAVDDLTETFRLYHERPSGLKERLANPLSRSSYTDFDALDGVSFRVQPGESVGVVGHNGSGKSTLLKVLAGILPPDGGEVATEGRVASLLELGAGFHGDLTGRENVYLNGAMLGLPRDRISEQLDAIVDFAGVRDFIDQPVRNFSSGMYVRLGFAVAVHVDPDILLVDEVLSVGDASFQEKSLERMASFQQRGKTVMLVSHDLNAIDRLCERVLVLDHGRVVYDGATREGVQLYAQWMGAAPETDHETDHDEPARLGSGDVRITDVTLLDDDAAPASRVLPSTRLTMRVNIEAARPVEACSVGATVEDADGTRLYEVHTTWQGLGVGPLQTGETATVDISFTAHVLAGQYRIRPTVTDATGRTPFDVAAVPAEFNVQPAPGGAGTVDLVAATAVIDGPSLRLEGGAQAR